MSEATGVGIGIGASFGVIALLGLGYAGYSGKFGDVGGVFKSFFFVVTNFIPLGLVLFGFIADLIGQEFRYSIGSIVGLAAIAVNWILKIPLESFFSLPPPVVSAADSGQVMCFIPGLEMFENRVTPMNFVSSTAILTYFLIFAALNRTPQQNISIGVAFPVILLTQLTTFYVGNCDAYYPAGWAGKLAAIVLGVVVGASGYGIVANTDPTQAPFMRVITTNPYNPGGWQGAREPSSGSGVGSSQNSAKCSAANTDDDNAYVCEAYKNGVLVTEKIT